MSFMTKQMLEYLLVPLSSGEPSSLSIIIEALPCDCFLALFLSNWLSREFSSLLLHMRDLHSTFWFEGALSLELLFPALLCSDIESSEDM